jgi:hypothetical protein
MFYSFEVDETPHYTYTTNMFTPEQCKKIIEIGLSLNPIQAGLIEKPKGDNKIRKSSTSWIQPVPEFKWIFDSIAPKIKYINDNSFKFNIYGFNEGLQFTHYKAPGGHYTQHIDKQYKYVIRRLSFSILLNDPSTFKGGDLLIYDGEKPKPMERKLGSMCMFPSYVLHQVTPVTKGERFSLVGWITGANIR